MLRRIGLTAAGLVVTLALALFLATSVRAKTPLAHTCSVTDRQFIEVAKTNMTAIGLWGQQYLSGDADAAEVVQEAKRAAKTVEGTAPTDPSLSQTRKLMLGMFGSYAKAVQAQARRSDAGPNMFRAYGLANYAHEVLVKAAPGLRKLGCELAPLL